MEFLVIASISINLFALVLAMRLLYRTREWRLSFLAAIAVLAALDQWSDLPLAGELSASTVAAFRIREFTDVLVSVMVLLLVFFVGRLIENERRRTEELRAGEARYRSLYDDTPVMLHSTDPNGCLIDVNRHWLKVMGYDRNEVLGVDSNDFLTEGSRRHTESVALPDYYRSGRASEIPISLTTKSGETVEALLSSVAENDEHGTFVSSRTVIVDVTKQRVAERAKQESENSASEARTLLLEAMESSPYGIAIYDSDDRLKLYNEAFQTGIMSDVADLIEPGVRFEQLVRAAVGRNLIAVPEGDVDGYVRMRLEQHRRGDSSIEVELTNGRWMLSNERRLPGGGTIGTRSDITERKRAELVTRESRRQAAEALALLTEAMESSPDAIGIYDADDRLTHFNEAFRTGISSEMSDVIKLGARFEDLLRTAMERKIVAVPDGDDEAYFDARMEHHRRGDRNVDFELADGRYFLSSERRMSGGGTVSTRSEITERRRAELALQESERRLRTIIENVPGIVFRRILHADGSISFPFASSQYMRTLGIDPADVMKNSQIVIDRLHADDLDGWMAAWCKSAKSLAPFDREVRFYRLPDELRWFRIRAIPQRLPDGETLWDAIGIDVTDEKRASEVRDRMFAAMENLSEGVALLNPDDILVFANRRFIELNEEAGPAIKPGRSFEETIREIATLGRFIEAVGREEEWIEERLEAHRNLPYAAERRVGTVWQEIREEALPDGSTIFLITDISIRKRAERAIRKNEQQLTLITENAPAMISHIGRDERFRFANSAYQKSFGVPPHSMRGMSLREYWGEKIYATIADKVKRVLAGETVSFENRLPGKDGGKRYLAVTYVPHIVDGSVEAFFSLATDITQLVTTRQALREGGHRIRNILENIADGVITINEAGKIQSFNQAAERMFGYAATEIIGREIANLMPEPDRGRHPQYIRNYLKTGKGKIIGVGRREVTARRKDGRTFPASLAVSAMSVNGKRSFIGSLLDLTQQEAAKEALRARDARLRQLQSELLRVNRAATIGQLSSSLTHELKQPLAAASFYMQAIRQLLKKGGATTDKEIAEIIGKVGGQVERAAAVVGRLGPLFERGEVQRKELNINELVEDAVAVAALELDRKNIDLKTILGRNLPRPSVDRIQVQQVLLNLVRNGVEATRDSKQRKLTVRTRATKDSKIEVSVSDTGSGIPSKLRSRMFEPFVTTRTGGTGMGLSVSRTIVEAHGGHIWASPRRGGGTIMHFTLELVAREFGRSTTNVKK